MTLQNWIDRLQAHVKEYPEDATKQVTVSDGDSYARLKRLFLMAEEYAPEVGVRCYWKRGARAPYVEVGFF